MASKKRGKGAKAKKTSPSGSRPSSASSKGDEPRDLMPGLGEASDAFEDEVSRNIFHKSGRGAGATGASAKGPVARLVYFDPTKILPSADRRTGENHGAGC